MNKYHYLLAMGFVALSLALTGCKKENTPSDPNTDPSDNVTSKIVATVFDTPLTPFRKGSLDIEGNTLWFVMEYESQAYHTPYQGVAVLATPKPEGSGPYEYDKAILLSYGDEIGPSGQFSQSDTIDFLEAHWHYYDDTVYSGISFQKEGKTHYGWVKYRFETVQCRAYIYGYAYESVPGKSIKAGATK